MLDSLVAEHRVEGDRVPCAVGVVAATPSVNDERRRDRRERPGHEDSGRAFDEGDSARLDELAERVDDCVAGHLELGHQFFDEWWACCFEEMLEDPKAHPLGQRWFAQDFEA